jgi:hypothetical protein
MIAGLQLFMVFVLNNNALIIQNYYISHYLFLSPLQGGWGAGESSDSGGLGGGWCFGFRGVGGRVVLRGSSEGS